MTLNQRNERREDQHLANSLRVADVAEDAIRKIWDEFLKLIQTPMPPAFLQSAIARLLRQIPLQALNSLGPAFDQLAKETHTQTARDLVNTLPDHAVTNLLAKRGVLERETGDRTPIEITIFPAPHQSIFDSIIYQSGWQNHFARLTALAAPDALAAQIAFGAAAGETPVQMAKRLLPHVQGVQASARRIARTEGLRIAHTIQHAAYEELGDMVIGYQIHCVKDSRTRPEHRKRDGTKYFKHPKLGELSVSVMPHPPLEADGKPAFNCRCWLEPILKSS